MVLEQSYKSLIASQHHSCHHRVLEPLRKWPEFQPTKANLLGPLVLVVTEVWWIEVLKAMPIIVTQACESLDVGIVAVLQHTHSITTPSPAFTLLGPLTVKVVWWIEVEAMPTIFAQACECLHIHMGVGGPVLQHTHISSSSKHPPCIHHCTRTTQ